MAVEARPNSGGQAPPLLQRHDAEGSHYRISWGLKRCGCPSMAAGEVLGQRPAASLIEQAAERTCFMTTYVGALGARDRHFICASRDLLRRGNLRRPVGLGQ